MTESQLQKKMLDRLNSINNCKAIPTTQGLFGRKGEPDIIGSCYPPFWESIPFVIEVKLPGNLPTKIQHKRLKEWESAGAKAACLDSMEGLEIFINEELLK